jgi:putative ABC transport system permease protein
MSLFRLVLADSAKLVERERQQHGRMAAAWLAFRILMDLVKAAVRGIARSFRAGRVIGSIGREARHAGRRLRRGGGVTLTTVAIVALAVGATVAVAAVVSAAFYDASGIVEPKRVVSLQRTQRPSPTSPPLPTTFYFEYPDYERMRATGVFERAAASAYTSVPCSCRAEGRPVLVGLVTDEFFEVFGIKPYRGRFPGPGERRGVVVSHVMAREHFGGPDAALGKPVIIRERSFAIVGVTPPSFTGPFLGVEPALWISMNDQPDVYLAPKFLRNMWPDLRNAKGYSWVQVWGRVPAAVLLEAVRQRLLEGRSGLEVVDAVSARVAPQLRDVTRQFLTGVSVAALLLLLLCAAALMQVSLLRAERTVPEMALKLGLGAPLTAVVAAPLLDAAVVVLAGGALGLALAPLLLQGFLLTLPPTTVSMSIDVSVLNWRTGLVAVGLLLLLSLLPPLVACARLYRRRRDVVGLIGGSSSRVAITGLRRAGAAAVLIQTTSAAALVAVVLLVLSGLLASWRSNLGFRPDRLLVVEFDLDHRNMTDAEGIAFTHRLREVIRATPSVVASTFSEAVPVNVLGRGSVLSLDPRPRSVTYVDTTFVDSNFFEVLEVPVKSGSPRIGSAKDPRVLNERMVRLEEEWRLKDPKYPIEPIGAVVDDVRYGTVFGVINPTSYERLEDRYEPRVKALVRIAGSEEAASAALRERLAAVSPDLRHTVIRPMSANLAVAEWVPRALSRVMGLFAIVALAVALAGTFAVVAFVGQCRRREFAIRSALGARRAHLHRLSLSGAAWPILVGGAIGAVLAWRSAAWIRTLLGTDGGHVAVVVATATAACVCLGLAAAWLGGSLARRETVAALLKVE